MTAFRFTRKPATSDDFLPVGVKDPARGTSCSAFGLSLFDTLANARAKWRSLKKRIDVASKLGDHIAELAVELSDGHCTVASDSGHFDLHEFTTTDLLRRVTGYHQV